jgi:hypothetical protein
MFIPKRVVSSGTKVVLPEGRHIEVFTGKFIGPHEFTITAVSDRGWDLIDNEGRKISEALFIQDLFDIIE